MKITEKRSTDNSFTNNVKGIRNSKKSGNVENKYFIIV